MCACARACACECVRVHRQREAWGSPPAFPAAVLPPFLSQPHRSKHLRIDRPVCEPWKGPVGAGWAARAGSLACGRGRAEGSAARRPHGLGQHCPFALAPQRARSPQGGRSSPAPGCSGARPLLPPPSSHWTRLAAPPEAVTLTLTPDSERASACLGDRAGVSGVPEPSPQTARVWGSQGSGPGPPRNKRASWPISQASGRGGGLGTVTRGRPRVWAGRRVGHRPRTPRRSTLRRLHRAVGWAASGEAPHLGNSPPPHPLKPASPPD